MMRAVGALVESKLLQAGRDISDKGTWFYDNVVVIGHLVHRRKEMQSAGLTIMQGMVDPLVTGRGMKMESGKPKDYIEKKFVDLNNFLLSTFLRE